MIKWIILFLCTIGLFGFSPSYAEDETLEVLYLVKQDLDKNFDLIKIKSVRMSEPERTLVYSKMKKCATLPSLANLFIGFGSGSYFNGDLFGGTTQLIAELIGFGMIISYNYSESTLYGLPIASSLVIASSRIYSFFKAGYYADEYNKNCFYPCLKIRPV